MRNIWHYGKDSLPYIEKGLKDQDVLVRLAALYSAFYLQEDGLDLLENMRQDPVPEIRDSANQMISRLKHARVTNDWRNFTLSETRGHPCG